MGCGMIPIGGPSRGGRGYVDGALGINMMRWELKARTAGRVVFSRSDGTISSVIDHDSLSIGRTGSRVAVMGRAGRGRLRCCNESRGFVTRGWREDF